MANKQSLPKSYSTKRGLRPGQDIFVTPRAKEYPGVGITLRSYGSRPQAIPGKAVPKVPPRQSLWKRWKLKRVLITLLIIFSLIGAALGGKFLYNAHKLFGGNIFSILQTTKLKGEDSGRVNILLAGNSADDAGHAGAQLTDSIMIISIDTKNNKAFLLSVPRDLWVDIGDNGHGKINEAYVDGQNNHFSDNGYPAGGMGQLQQVIENNFGLTINYYALVNYNAFRDAVNAVGGIDVVIKSTDPRGLYDPSIDYATKGPLVKLTNGPHHLNGVQALDLARARGDNYRAYGFNQSDFDRTEHQRQMLVALKSKAVSVGVVTNPARLSSLSDAIGNNVKTNLSLSEVHRLYDLTKSIDGGNLSSISLNDANGKNLLINYQSPRGESALIPAAGLDDFSDIQQLIKQLTSNNPIVQESAKVVVLNATDSRGLASHVRTTLEAKNLNVTAVGDALANQTTTTIIDNSAGHKPATKQALQAVYGKTVVFTTTNPYAAKYSADFIVVIGADQVKSATTTTSSN